METIYINGKYLSQTTTGVQRYAKEVVWQFEIDNFFREYEFVVVCPENASIPEGFNHIKYVKIKRKGYFFEQISLPRFLKKNKAKYLLNLCNLAPLRFAGATVVHDLNIVDNKKYYGFLYRNIVKFITKRNIKKYRPVFTVSEFSKKRITEYFKIDSNRVVVTKCGIFQRMDIEDYSDKFAFVKEPFYLTVGSFNKTKNLNYVLETAKRNKDKTFVITGGKGKVYQEVNLDEQENVIFTGYLTDKELFYLYNTCYAFILPSFYEGFGIPPLEAILYGCKRIILSNIEVFKEIYGDIVEYCDPYDVKTIQPILENPKQITEEEAQKVLNKYSWNKTARIIFDGIREVKK